MILDYRGRRCPLPIIALAQHIEDVEVGETLLLDADDPAAAPDVAAWCRMRGHELVATTPADDGTPRFEVRRLR